MILVCSMCPLTCSVSNFDHREAEGFKEQGNAFYVKKDYAEAYNYYTKAIGNFARILLLIVLSVQVPIVCSRLT